MYTTTCHKHIIMSTNNIFRIKTHVNIYDNEVSANSKPCLLYASWMRVVQHEKLKKDEILHTRDMDIWKGLQRCYSFQKCFFIASGKSTKWMSVIPFGTAGRMLFTKPCDCVPPFSFICSWQYEKIWCTCMQPSDVHNLYKHKGFHIKLIGLFWKWGESF